jgi:hypothetical protein
VEQPACAHTLLDKMHMRENQSLRDEVLSWPVSEILEKPEREQQVWTPRPQFVFFNALPCFQPFFS